ncbi:hypothetical protein NDU88_009957 [Pleurodeles waltl]|uniref:Uncharacterized protein n=1 Tax=Pleurodeles waltl TaxID=8319 RepID=A0AAV7RXR9_PLEWA|nr:hypothetical protein NDU88_009957 [Pleurodeles waltl]
MRGGGAQIPHDKTCAARVEDRRPILGSRPRRGKKDTARPLTRTVAPTAARSGDAAGRRGTTVYERI